MNQFQTTLRTFVVFTILFLSLSETSAQDQTFTFPNTSIHINLPSGFQTISDESVSSIRNSATNTEFITTIIPGPYSIIKQQLTPESFAEQGASVSTSEPVLISGNDGVMFMTTQTTQGITTKKYILIFGDNSNTFMVLATFDDTTPNSQIRDFLTSVHF